MDSQTKKLDFNLLKLFVALMETRSVSAAAEQLNITQSATSHALRRLREAFSDNLFVVTKEGMIPTARALNIHAYVLEAINLINTSFNSQKEFDPATSCRTFVIMASEYFELVVLPVLACEFRKVASTCNLEVRRLRSDVPVKEMQTGNIDLMIGFDGYIKLDSALKSEPLLSDRLVCVVGKNNALVGDRVSLETYMTMSHIYPAPWGQSSNMVENWLVERGLSRKISLTVHNYLSTPLLAEKTDCLLTLPARIFELLKPMASVRRVEPPAEDYPSFTINMVYHSLFEMEPANLWLRAKVQEICRRLA